MILSAVENRLRAGLV